MEEKVELKAISPEQAEKLGPQALVLNNARILIHSELKNTKDLIEQSLAFMKNQLTDESKEDYDFRENPQALIGIQLQLASLSLAVEYWIAKHQKTHRIKVYNQGDMPKA